MLLATKTGRIMAQATDWQSARVNFPTGFSTIQNHRTIRVGGGKVQMWEFEELSNPSGTNPAVFAQEIAYFCASHDDAVIEMDILSANEEYPAELVIRLEGWSEVTDEDELAVIRAQIGME